MSTFVLEIGSEELPARFLEGEKEALVESFTKSLAAANLEHGQIVAYATPRRATVVLYDLAPMQAETEEVVAGPPVRIAYDQNGNPTKALLGFLKTQQVQREDLFEQKTPKGIYLAVKRKVGGLKASQILAEICPSIIQSLPFAKRMRWATSKLAYARPIHWLLALLDQEVVDFQLDELTSGRQTFGHRIHGLGPFEVSCASAYFDVLHDKCGVVLDSQKRRNIIVQLGNEQAAKLNGKILWNDHLLTEVEGLVEHPVPLLGEFDASYLEVPREVLLTSMESHQKSFGVEGQDGKLLPLFLTVLNIEPTDLNVVKRGWERVLHARLEDAKFFYHEDLRANFSAWLDKLDHVIFIGPLGSMGDKTRRLEKLTHWLAVQVGVEDRLLPLAQRCGRLSKADLVSGMVGEFDTLQGIMGGIYARAWSETEEVAAAIAEQYLPAGPETSLPKTVLGALLSIADKADTLTGCFALNKIPTGTADPNALRRCALGIIRIAKAFDLKINLRALFTQALSLYGERKWKSAPDVIIAKLLDFLSVRLQNYLQTQGYNVIITEAILKAGMENVPDVFTRIKAFKTFQDKADYVDKVQLLKRVGNILQKQGQELPLDYKWQTSLFEHETEHALAEILQKGLELSCKDPNYTLRLEFVSTLRPYVDNFFNAVMVMAENKNVRLNRLALLKAIADIYAQIVDFSALQI